MSLVLTIASLQYSMPVHAIVARRTVAGPHLQAQLGRGVDQLVRPASASTSRSTSFCCGVSRIRPEPNSSARSASAASDGSVDPARPSARRRHRRRRPAAGARPTWSRSPAGTGSGAGPSTSVRVQVLVLEHLAEPLGAPVGDQELQPRPVAQPPVAVVAEDADDPGPHVGHLVQRHPGAQPLRQHRVGRQPAADPHVEAGAVLGVHHAHEGDVVDLVRDVVARRPGDRRLELARQVGELGSADDSARTIASTAGVPSMISSAATPATGEPRIDARSVAAGLGRAQPDALQPPPDLGHVLDADPVQLDVLPVGDVGGVRGRTRWRSPRSRGSASLLSAPPSERMRIMKYSSSRSSGGSVAVLPPSIPGRRCV